jgi:cell division protein FtsB
VPRAAKKKRPGKALTWLKRLLWSFNLVLLCTLCLGAYQYFDAREKTDNARLALSKAVERQKELQAERDGAAAYVNAMQNENSSLLLNEARERLNMAQPDEVIINLKEKI